MANNLEKISSFINEHHVMSLASSNNLELSVCSLFYAYSSDELSFVVASSDNTTHIKNIKQNKNIAGNILLETKSVGKIQGLQFRGEFVLLEDENLRKLYFQEFPYALAMQPKLWKIKVNYFKLTDNRFGFGNKLIWQEPL
uniref:Uncharacterized protein n=1 Tax=uncultured Campylobacterota bacterium TaxID=120858 RepID=Q2YZJ9_9BACT|nr:hypothetical protein [uncultured Campylobacterota bacterium]